MAEKEKKVKPAIDKEHDKTITLMVGVLIILVAVAAILVACSYYLNHM